MLALPLDEANAGVLVEEQQGVNDGAALLSGCTRAGKQKIKQGYP